MSVTANTRELRRQMAVRGLAGSDLAELAGLSAATVSHALGGRPIAPKTLRALVQALDSAPSFGSEFLAEAGR